MTGSHDTATDVPRSLVLVGAGKMGAAMLEGWLATGLDPVGVTVIDPHPSPALGALAAARGFALAVGAAGVPSPEVLVLAVKPQMLGAVAPSLAPLVARDTLVLSIVAGKTSADLARLIPGADAIVRAMPNLPASIRRGATGAFATASTSERQRAAADALLAGIGVVEWVADEALIDAVTAVSGSGPAYLFHLAECLAEAGVAAGLERGLSDRLARATITGAAALLAESGEDPAALRRDVTSPGGTTAAALDILMGPHGLAPLVTEAVAAAKRRAAELAG